MRTQTRNDNYVSPVISDYAAVLEQEIICGSLGTDPYEEFPIDWD